MKENIVNIALPGLYSNFQLNKLFINLFINKREIFYDWIKINKVYGSFPNNIWGLERYEYGNISITKLQKVIDFYKEKNIQICLEMDNPFIENKHLNNNFLNKILKGNNDNKTSVFINSNILREHIRNNYNNILIETSDKNIIADIYEINKSEIKNIKEKENVIIQLNNFCKTNCRLQTTHIKYLSLEQLENKEITPYFPCDMENKCDFEYIKKHENFISINELKDIIKNEKYINFKIESNKLLKYLQQYCTLTDLAKFYIYYLIKEKYKKELQEIILKTIEKN